MATPDTLRISIRSEHIAAGKAMSTQSDPISLALLEQHSGFIAHSSHYQGIDIVENAQSRCLCYEIPPEIGDWQRRFDLGKSVHPITFEATRKK